MGTNILTSLRGTLKQREPLPKLMNFSINEVRQPLRELVKLIHHFLLTIGHSLLHFRQLCDMTQLMPEFHFPCFCSVTEFMQPLGQGNNMLPSFFVRAHSTLDVPVVLRSTHKNFLVTEKRSNRLDVRLGNKSHFWLINCPRGHHLQCGFPSLLPLAIEASSE